MKLKLIAASAALALASITLPGEATAANYIKIGLEGVDPANGAIISGTLVLAETGFIPGDVLEDDIGVYSRVYGALRIGDVTFSDTVMGFYPYFFEFREIRGTVGNSRFNLLGALPRNSFGMRSSFSYSLNGGPPQVVSGGAFSRFSVIDSAVPEPATWGLLVVGFGAIGAAIRRGARHVATFA